MFDQEMTDKNNLLATAASSVDADAPSNVGTSGDYGTLADQETSLEDKRKAIPCPACRHVLLLMMFLGYIAAYSLRGCFNETIVSMVNQTAVNEDAVTDNNSDVYECPRDEKLEESEGEFNWDRHQQSLLLSAFYYGYILTQVIACIHVYDVEIGVCSIIQT